MLTRYLSAPQRWGTSYYRFHSQLPCLLLRGRLYIRSSTLFISHSTDHNSQEFRELLDASRPAQGVNSAITEVARRVLSTRFLSLEPLSAHPAGRAKLLIL